jgi:hypothetical protein
VKELGSLKRVFGELKKAPLTNFPPARKRMEAPDAQGVYIIYSPQGRVLHVGRTPRGKKGLRQRLNNHLHAGSSFTLRYLDGHGARLRNGYKFRCLAVESPRLRALLEAYATGMLCPAHLGLDEAVV